jgi:TonB family protein
MQQSRARTIYQKELSIAQRKLREDPMLRFLSLTLIVLVSAGFQIQKRTCDHPAPPEGMHYVCVPQNPCDCRLEKDSSEDVGSPAASEAIEPCSADKVKYFVAPAYPETARKAGKQATVTAQLTVENLGIAHVRIESGDPVFAEAVQTALHKWRFAPSAAGQTLTATFTFALAGTPTEHISTTVSGASPLNLVISAPPVR